MSKGFNGLIEKVNTCGVKKVAVAVAQDAHVLEAVRAAKERKIAEAILVGDKAKIEEVAASINMDLEGNPKAKLVIDAFCYQIAKSIGKCATVLKGDVQAIVFTGGIAYSDYIISKISERVDWIAPIVVYPGEDEMLALAQGALRVLNGEEQAKEYF